MAELERAKIIERLTRGKQHRLRQGYLLSQGHNTFGYDYIKRTKDSPAQLVINEKEAAMIRQMFNMYAKGDTGVGKISQYLEEQRIARKAGGKVWHRSAVKYILQNEVYTGIRYYNTEHYVREYANPLHGIQYSSGKKVLRPREEWIGIKIPQIIPKHLFLKVQKRFE